MSNPTEIDSPVRIAIRDEGEWIRFYMAERHTMKDAVLVATLRRSVAQMPGVFDEFVRFGKALSKIVIEETFGPGTFVAATMEPAPEHERGLHPPQG
jgi:hypothetical protein